MLDKYAVACNLTEPISAARKGALAYISNPNWGWAGARVKLLLRSRNGRWIEKWEGHQRLASFRVKTIPPEHPLYDDNRLCMTDSRELAERMIPRVTVG